MRLDKIPKNQKNTPENSGAVTSTKPGVARAFTFLGWISILGGLGVVGNSLRVGNGVDVAWAISALMSGLLLLGFGKVIELLNRIADNVTSKN